MKTESSILQDSLKFFKKPKITLTSILESDDFNLDKKKFFFIAFMSLYSIFLPSTMVFLLILVIPFVLIMIGYIYFLSQEISIIYFEAQGKDYEDQFLYKVAYCLSLLAVPSMLLSLAVNLFFMFRADNFLLAGILSLAFAFVPLLFLAFYLNMFMGIVSSGAYGLLKVIELSFVSLLSTLKAKFGWEVIEEIKIDLKSLDS